MKGVLIVYCLFASLFAYADQGQIKDVIISSGPSLYLNSEYGIFYADTGAMPAQIQLLCSSTAAPNADLQPCGKLDVSLRMHSYGLSAFWLDYTRKNPLVVHLHVDPYDTTLDDVLGNYVGGRAGGGVVLGLRGMILVNSASGVFAHTEQNLFPGQGENHSGWGLDVGVDLSVPVLQVSYDGADAKKTLASFVETSL